MSKGNKQKLLDFLKVYGDDHTKRCLYSVDGHSSHIYLSFEHATPNLYLIFLLASEFQPTDAILNNSFSLYDNRGI
jgi:hypothetical protein